MIFQMLLLLEIHFAMVALEWSFVGVCSPVLDKDIFSGEDLWTEVARKISRFISFGRRECCISFSDIFFKLAFSDQT